MKLDSRTCADLNYLKAFAAFLVVFGHCLAYYSDRHGMPLCAEVLMDMIYAVHVPLFFVISGFLCRRQPLRSYYRKKLFRVLIPFFFFAALKLVYSCVVYGDHARGWGTVLVDAFVVGRGYWFAYAILLMFALASLVWEKDAETPPRKAVILFALLVVYNAATSIIGISLLPNIFQIHNTVKYLPFFLSGMILRSVYPELQKVFALKRGYIVGFAFAVSAAAALSFFFDIGIDPYIRLLFTSYALMILLLEIAHRLPENNRFLTLAGGFSYQIMLLDSFFKVLLFAVAERFVGASLPLAAAVAVLDYLLSILVCRIARKIPVVKTLVGLQ